MAVWSGLGMNLGHEYLPGVVYDASRSQGDIRDIKAMGITRARIAMTSYNNPTAVASLKSLALDCKSAGLHTLYGQGYYWSGADGKIRSSSWAAWLSNLLTNVATWAQMNEMDELSIGNEMDYDNTNQLGTDAVTSATRLSNVVTITTPIDHGYTVGEKTVISGATPSNYNGTVTITDVPTSTTFTYTAAGVDGTATGTVLCRIDFTTVMSRLKTAATAVQPVFTRGPVVYNVGQDQETNWVAGGKGDLDRLDLNVYGTSGTFASFQSHIANHIAAFGVSGAQLSEWNLHATFGSYPSWTVQEAKIRERLAYLKSIPDLVGYFFCYRGNAGDNFALRYTAGGFRDWWNVLSDKRPIFKQYSN